MYYAKITPNMYLFVQKILALILLIVFSPLLVLLFILVKLDSPGPFIFKQKRAGFKKKPFTMYKIRTMVENAEKLQDKYAKLNEADGPVFKIKNDPRYTRIGKVLARSAIDEIPQLLNVLKSEMALVGPRPLPIEEAKQIPKKYQERFSIFPGMTSNWVVKGNHKLKFDTWMELDLDYVGKKSFKTDCQILFQTVSLIIVALFGYYKTDDL